MISIHQIRFCHEYEPNRIEPKFKKFKLRINNYTFLLRPSKRAREQEGKKGREKEKDSAEDAGVSNGLVLSLLNESDLSIVLYRTNVSKRDL